MGVEEREKFLAALQNKHETYNFDSIMASISKVDASKAECRNKDDQEAILRELEYRVGTHECNKVVRRLLRQAVVSVGRGALDAMPEDERATSALLSNMGRLRSSPMPRGTAPPAHKTLFLQMFEQLHRLPPAVIRRRDRAFKVRFVGEARPYPI